MSSHERSLDKRRTAGDSIHASARAKEDGANAEVSESFLMGGGNEDREEFRRQQDRQHQRQVCLVLLGVVWWCAVCDAWEWLVLCSVCVVRMLAMIVVL